MKYSEKKVFTVIHNKIEKTRNYHFQSELYSHLHSLTYKQPMAYEQSQFCKNEQGDLASITD